jgi:hypothetical protein
MDDGGDDGEDADWSTVVPELIAKRMSPLLELLVESELDKLSDGYIRKVCICIHTLMHLISDGYIRKVIVC